MLYVLILLSIYAFYRGLRWLEKTWAVKKWKWLVIGPLYLISMMGLAIVIRLFFFEVCIVPSGSMEDTIQINDHILINKIAYGPRMPRHITDIPWLHVLYYFAFGADQYHQKTEETKQIKRKRAAGYTSIKRGDLLIFESPTGSGNLLIKRCIAIPGDTLSIKAGLVYINDRVVAQPPLYKMNYQIFFDPSSDFLQRAKSISPTLNTRNDTLLCQLNHTQFEALKQIHGFKGFIPSLKLPDTSGVGIWPEVRHTTWSKDYYGPIYIPTAGSTVPLDSTDMIPNEFMSLEKTTYIPENYYFVMGDHRHQSMDSRVWGLVPESSIKGKGSMVLYNTRKGKFWQRFLRIL